MDQCTEINIKAYTITGINYNYYGEINNQRKKEGFAFKIIFFYPRDTSEKYQDTYLH